MKSKLSTYKWNKKCTFCSIIIFITGIERGIILVKKSCLVLFTLKRGGRYAAQYNHGLCDTHNTVLIHERRDYIIQGIVRDDENTGKLCFKSSKEESRAGLTRTYVGKNGGFAVNKPAQQIDLLSIIEIMENTVKINRCLEEDEYCSRFATATCPVRSFYCILQDELESKLSSITIKSLLDGLKNKERMEANEKNKGISCADGDVYPDI